MAQILGSCRWRRENAGCIVKAPYLVNKTISIPLNLNFTTRHPSLRWENGNVERLGFRAGGEPLRTSHAKDGITLNDFPGRFTSNAVHALGLTYSRCFMRLDLNQGRAKLIGMYCKDVDNPGPAMSQIACVEINELTEANGSAGSRLPSVAGVFA